jgi:hypothetical protein
VKNRHTSGRGLRLPWFALHGTKDCTPWSVIISLKMEKSDSPWLVAFHTNP